MTLIDRWTTHLETTEDTYDGKDFAIRGDGALVIFDEQGWFLVVSTGPGKDPTGQEVPDVKMLEDPEGNREAVYVEPVWLTGYYESVQA